MQACDCSSLLFGGLAYRSAEVLPICCNALSCSAVVATLRMSYISIVTLSGRGRMLSDVGRFYTSLSLSVAVKALCLLRLYALGSTSALHSPRFAKNIITINVLIY